MDTNQQPIIETPEPIKWRGRSLNNLDYLVLMVMCILTIGVALHDKYTLRETESRCLDDCNRHWVSEFKDKCAGPWSDDNLTKTLIYNYPIPGTSSPPENP